MTRRFAIGLVAALCATLLAGCPGEERPAVEVGRELFGDPDFSPSSFNQFACSTCHTDAETDRRGRILPGLSLAGVANRETYWGGAEDQLLGAVNFCLVTFMRGVALTPEDPEGRALAEYLKSISPGTARTPGLPFTILHTIDEITSSGNPDRGQATYAAACQGCHGSTGNGRGKLDPKSLTLPKEATDYYDKNLPGISYRLIFTEKIRHGAFFGIGGVMPLFGAERISDDQLADIFAYLGI